MKKLRMIDKQVQIQTQWALGIGGVRANSPTKVDLLSKVMVVKSSIPGPVNAEYSVPVK